jgi:hypothetical protein
VGEGVAQDLVLFPFARPDDHLGPHASRPVHGNRGDSRRAVRSRLATEPIIAHVRRALPTGRTSAGSEPLLPTTRPRAPPGTRRPPPPAPCGPKWYQRPWGRAQIGVCHRLSRRRRECDTAAPRNGGHP